MTEKREHDHEPLDNDHEDMRVLTVRLPVAEYRFVRTVAVTRDMPNGEVIAWAVELLERYVAAGGAR